jgi:hypothetical protein
VVGARVDSERYGYRVGGVQLAGGSWNISDLVWTRGADHRGAMLVVLLDANEPVSG